MHVRWRSNLFADILTSFQFLVVNNERSQTSEKATFLWRTHATRREKHCSFRAFLCVCGRSQWFVESLFCFRIEACIIIDDDLRASTSMFTGCVASSRQMIEHARYVPYSNVTSVLFRLRHNIERAAVSEKKNAAYEFYPVVRSFEWDHSHFTTTTKDNLIKPDIHHDFDAWGTKNIWQNIN